MNRKFFPAIKGLISGFADHGILIQWIFAFLAVSAGMILKLNSSEWCIVIALCGLVIAMEMMNTCLERICDYVQPEMDERIKYIKDMAAGAVLVSSLAALLAALLIFMNHVG